MTSITSKGPSSLGLLSATTKHFPKLNCKPCFYIKVRLSLNLKIYWTYSTKGGLQMPLQNPSFKSKLIY